MIILIIYVISLIVLLIIIANVETDENESLIVAILPIINTLTLLFIIGYVIKHTYKYCQECMLDKEKEKPFYQFLNTRLT